MALDEPEASLDREARARVAGVVASSLAGRTAIVVTHDEAFAAIGTRVVTLPAFQPTGASTA